jgi:hypothetical protein
MTDSRGPIAAVSIAVVIAVMALSTSASQTRLISITEYVSVVRNDGTPIEGLPRSAFQLTSNDQPVPIDSVSQATAPLTIALVLDATASIAFFELPAKLLEQSFLGRLRPGDRARVLTVATSPLIDDAWTDDVKVLKRSIERALDGDRTGPSPIWDTLWHASVALSSEPGPRVILLSTDGRTTGNERGFFDVLHDLSIDNVTVAVISSAMRESFGQMGGKQANVRPDATLRALAAHTGGPFYVDSNLPTRPPPKPAKPAPDAPPADLRLRRDVIFARVMTELQRRYAVTFVVPADGQFHHLRVTVQQPGATVRARAMYLAK